MEWIYLPCHTLCTDVNVDYIGLECCVQLPRLVHKSYFYSPFHLHPRINNSVYHGVARHVLINMRHPEENCVVNIVVAANIRI
jgi:hypothetical protein